MHQADVAPGLSATRICIRCSCREGDVSASTCHAFGLACVFDAGQEAEPAHPAAPSPSDAPAVVAPAAAAPQELPSDRIQRLVRERVWESESPTGIEPTLEPPPHVKPYEPDPDYRLPYKERDDE